MSSRLWSLLVAVRNKIGVEYGASTASAAKVEVEAASAPGDPRFGSVVNLSLRFKCSMLNAQCSMLNAQCSMLNAQCSMLTQEPSPLLEG